MTWRNESTRCPSTSAAGPLSYSDGCLNRLHTWTFPLPHAACSRCFNASGAMTSRSTSAYAKPPGYCPATHVLPWRRSMSCRKEGLLPLRVIRTSTPSRGRGARRVHGDCAGFLSWISRRRMTGRKLGLPVYSVQRKTDLWCTQCNANFSAGSLWCTQCNANGTFQRACGVPSAPYLLLPLPTATTNHRNRGSQMRVPLFSRRRTGDD